ncbi:MAG: histidine phosphatase family protein [Candidatus Cryosericum sp.]
MKTLYLARHAETIWNATARIQGRIDTLLSPLGVVQTAQSIAYLSTVPFGLVLSSPLVRARALADPVATALHCQLTVLQELVEVDFGRWQGHSWEEVSRMDPEAAAAWDRREPDARPDGGESLEEARGRALSVRNIVDSGQCDLCLIVAHGAFNRVLISTLLDLPLTSIDDFTQSNASVSIFEVHNGRWQARVIDSTCHLHVPVNQEGGLGTTD